MPKTYQQLLRDRAKLDAEIEIARLNRGRIEPDTGSVITFQERNDPRVFPITYCAIRARWGASSWLISTWDGSVRGQLEVLHSPATWEQILDWAEPGSVSVAIAWRAV